MPLLSCSDVAVEFGATTLLRDVSCTVAAGERWGIVGRNGAGKTTLLRLIDGSLAPARGTVTREPGLRIALLDQNRAFGGAASVWDAAASGYGSLLELEHDLARHIQNHLGAFGFSGDEVQRSTRVLSGGERARVALALLALRPANLLVLDEPTNDLDVESIEALEDGLEEYEGTIILVSHDRAFLRELATRVWAFDGDRIQDYAATFVEWEQQRAERARANRPARPEPGASAVTRTEVRKAAAARRESQEARRAAQREADAREQAVHAAEARIGELERALADPALYDGKAEGAREAGRLSVALARAKRALDEALARWAEASDAL